MYICIPVFAYLHTLDIFNTMSAPNSDFEFIMTFAELNSKCADLESKINDQLNDKCFEINESLADLKSEIGSELKSMCCKIDMLEREFAKSNNNYADLNELTNRLSYQLDENHIEVNAYAELPNENPIRADIIENMKSEFGEEISNLKDDIADLTYEFEGSNLKLDYLKKEISDEDYSRKNDTARLDSELLVVADKLDDLEDTVDNLSEKIYDKFVDLQKSVDNLDERFVDLKDNIADVGSGFFNIDDKLTCLEKKVSDLEGNLEDNVELKFVDIDAKFTYLDKAVSDLKDENSKLRNAVASLKISNNKLKRSSDKLKKRDVYAEALFTVKFNAALVASAVALIAILALVK